MRIENPFYCLEINRRGALHRLYDKQARLELIAEPRLAESWRLLLPLPRKGLSNLQVNYLLSNEQPPAIARRTADGLELRWDGPLVNAQGAWNVAVRVALRLSGPELETQVSVENRSKLTLAEVWCGGLGGLLGLGKRTETETLLPEYNAAITESLFRHFPAGLGSVALEFFRLYPWIGMPWFSLWNPRLGRGLYYACHDPEIRLKVFHAEMHPTLARLRVGGNWPTDAELRSMRKKHPAGVVLHWVHLPYLKPGRTFQSAPVVLRGHDGDWHAAAKIYRRWFTARFPLRRPADAWYRREQAVQDTVLLLPEGNVMKTFKDIPALARGAARHGVTTIMVSGWWKGGHDNQYPDYSPDKRLGTWADLRRAIAACHRLGVKVVFFANLETVDLSTDWYRRKLAKYRVIAGNGLSPTAGWGFGTLSSRIGVTTPPLGSCDVAFPEYRRVIVNQMRRLAAIGADGVHLDKVNRMVMDFNPALTVGPDRAMFAATLHCIEEILAKCRRIVPHFAVSVEMTWDRLLPYVDAWWDWIDGLDHVSPMKYAFPEWMPAFSVERAFDYNAVNNALRFGYQLLIGSAGWTSSLDDPQMGGLGRYIKEALRIRGRLRDTIFLGEFLDTLEVAVEPREHLRYNTHRNPATGRRACVLVNQGRRAVQTVVRFEGNAHGRVAIYRPFAAVVRRRLPARVAVAAERFAVVVEE